MRDGPGVDGPGFGVGGGSSRDCSSLDEEAGAVGGGEGPGCVGCVGGAAAACCCEPGKGRGTSSVKVDGGGVLPSGGLEDCDGGVGR